MTDPAADPVADRRTGVTGVPGTGATVPVAGHGTGPVAGGGPAPGGPSGVSGPGGPGSAEGGRSYRGGGLGSVGAERFDAMAAVGGWRGAAESVVPTIVFVTLLAVRPQALVPAVVVSLGVSAVALLLRLVQRQGTTQALGGAVVALVSAVWAWRSGEASNFYAAGLVINGVWLAACLVSVAVGWPLVGVVVSLVSSPAQRAGTGPATGSVPGAMAWRTDPGQRGLLYRYRLGTGVLAAMFCLRLAVEVPLYLAGDPGVSALGAARLVLGLPLFALTLWLVWMLVSPTRQPGRAGGAAGVASQQDGGRRG